MMNLMVFGPCGLRHQFRHGYGDFSFYNHSEIMPKWSGSKVVILSGITYCIIFAHKQHPVCAVQVHKYLHVVFIITDNLTTLFTKRFCLEKFKRHIKQIFYKTIFYLMLSK